MDGTNYYHGIDVGSTYVKSVIIDGQKEIIGYFVERTGPDHTTSIGRTFEGAMNAAGLNQSDAIESVATGFGRQKVPFAHSKKTEISCHAKGVFHYFSGPATIVDIGGQDTKIIRIDENGKKTGFRMNRKCAAGTGAFLEEISQRLEIPMNELNSYAERSTQDAPLSSFCTVFATTEVLQRIKDGEQVEDLVRSAFESVARRVIEMEKLEGTIVMTGGVVAHHPIIAEILGHNIDCKIVTPPQPQLSGALGAALYALQEGRSGIHQDGKDTLGAALYALQG